LLVSDVNTTKLWRISRTNTVSAGHVDGQEIPVLITLKRVFENAPHSAQMFHTNSLSLNSDGETFLSADELRVYLWNLHVGQECFNIVDLAPESLHLLTEVLRVAEFHPSHCHLFAYGTSTGAVRMCDLRVSALCDQTSRPLGDEEGGQLRKSTSGMLNDYMVGITDLSFSKTGNFLAARDVGGLRLWDLRMEDKPLMRYNVLSRERLLSHLYNCFEDGKVMDSFRCTFLDGESLQIATGTYDDRCVLWDTNSNGYNILHVGKPKPTSPINVITQQHDDLVSIQHSNSYKRRKFFRDDYLSEDETPMNGLEDVGMNLTPVVDIKPLSHSFVETSGNDTMLQPHVYGYEDGTIPISFAKKMSALAVDHSGEIFAMVGTGKMYIYDMAR